MRSLSWQRTAPSARFIVATRRCPRRGRAAGQTAGICVTLGPDHYVLPGMVDLHVHAPQWPQLGEALDLPLEEWLQKFTFPLEARYSDTAFAHAGLRVAGIEPAGQWHDHRNVLRDHSSGGDQGACRHLPAPLAARPDRPGGDGQSRPVSGLLPRPLRRRLPSARPASSSSYVQALPGSQGLIYPVITPRFIPSCTDELLLRLGKLARETGCHVQTHCSESDWQHQYVLERCGRTDTAALDSFGLLSRRTVLAHGNFVDDADAAIIRERGAGIAHCPLSNVYFSDAVFPLRRMLDAGVHVGLGTDIAGGASPSLLENARHAVINSRMLEAGVDARQGRVRAAPTGFAHRCPDGVLAGHGGRRHCAGSAGGPVCPGLPVRRLRDRCGVHRTAICRLPATTRRKPCCRRSSMRRRAPISARCGWRTGRSWRTSGHRRRRASVRSSA